MNVSEQNSLRVLIDLCLCEVFLDVAFQLAQLVDVDRSLVFPFGLPKESTFLGRENHVEFRLSIHERLC